MVKKKIYIPKNLIYIDKDDRQTLALQHFETGKMRGRRVVQKGERGDRTFPRRVRSGKWAGVILGRSKPIPVRASERARGTIRRNL